MQEIKIWYNQHRKRIWVTVGIIVAFILIIQFWNFLVSRNKNETQLNISSSSEIISEIENNTNVSISSTDSAITGESVDKDSLESSVTIIGEFFDYCEQGNIEEAYNMLTEECKEEMYSTQEEFQSLYVSEIFGTQNVTYTVQNWTGNIYKIDFSIGNILATGNPNDLISMQDYVTVERVDDTYKLNINDYIGRTEINKEEENDNIKITAIDKNTYMDYEEYTIKIENNSNSCILLLDINEDTNGAYIEDSNGVTYSAYIQELTMPEVTINSGDTRILNIKFYSSYVSTKSIEKLVFSNVIMDYDPTTGLKAGKETKEVSINL